MPDFLRLKKSNNVTLLDYYQSSLVERNEERRLKIIAILPMLCAVVPNLSNNVNSRKVESSVSPDDAIQLPEDEKQPKPEIKEQMLAMKQGPEEEGTERGDAVDTADNSEREDFVNNKTPPEGNQEENEPNICEPFAVVETKMEVSDKEHIDPSRYVIVVESQGKKKRQGKGKLRGRTRKRVKDVTEDCESKKKLVKKQDNQKKKSYVCDICREDLANDEDLQAHRRMRHINDKSEFFCDFCLKIFKTKAILKGHRYKHITDPQFLCVRCGKKYFTISNLNEHSLYCLDEKRFECPICNKKFNVNKQFKRHLVIHEADRYIKCTVCEQTFSRKDNYRQHFRRHTGEKPYTCDICGKSFRIKATYNYHKRTHRDVRPSDVDGIKTENTSETEYGAYRTGSTLGKSADYYYPVQGKDGDAGIRIPRTDGEFCFTSPSKGDGILREYVKREPSEVDHPNRRDCVSVDNRYPTRESERKEDKEQKSENVDCNQRVNVDYMVTTEFSRRDSSRLHPDYCPRKEDYPLRDGPVPLSEYHPRRTEPINDEYQTRLPGLDFTSRRESTPQTVYPSFPDGRVIDRHE
ncbi:hypothetical protein RUM44_013830 [Polyplax serrata]|uniref:C2H2-type domain-containing protein n=1 Tax=Polyplax serrata TaxID=468196 RepID=A0ABR1BIW5_POLSC